MQKLYHPRPNQNLYPTLPSVNSEHLCHNLTTLRLLYWHLAIVRVLKVSLGLFNPFPYLDKFPFLNLSLTWKNWSPSQRHTVSECPLTLSFFITTVEMRDPENGLLFLLQVTNFKLKLPWWGTRDQEFTDYNFYYIVTADWQDGDLDKTIPSVKVKVGYIARIT